MSNHILIVSDSAEAARVWAYACRQRGHRVELAATPDDARRLAAERSPDLVVVDVYSHAPAMLELSHRLRTHGAGPIILLASNQDESYILEAYRRGVDEVAVKPVSPLVLLAKVDSWLRRALAPPAAPAEILRAGKVILDPARRELCIQERGSFRLTNLETRLLQVLLGSPGQVFSSDYLIARLWGADGGDSGMLKNVVYRLRRKFETDDAEERYILTIPGQGYSIKVH